MSGNPTSLFHCTHQETGAVVCLPYKPEGPYDCVEYVPQARLQEEQEAYQVEVRMKAVARRQRDVLVSRLHRAVAICYEQGAEWDSDEVRNSRNYAKHCGDLIDRMARQTTGRDSTIRCILPWLHSDMRQLHGDGGAVEEAFYAGYEARLPRLRDYDLWQFCQGLADRPEIVEVMEAFSAGSTGDNGVEVIRALYQALHDAAMPALPAPTEVAAECVGAKFAVEDYVRKHTGDYNISGEVRAVFQTALGNLRYVVEHNAEGGGSFLHIYAEANLEPAERPPVYTCIGKGGEYERVGTSTGAGEENRGEVNEVYRDRTTRKLFHRSVSGFLSRMTRKDGNG